MIFLALGVAAESGAATNNRMSVVVFTIVWITAAMSRISELRRGERPALQLNRLDLHTAAVLAVGCGSWVVLGFLQNAYPASAAWKPIDVPLPLWAFGVALAVAVVAEPFVQRTYKAKLAADEPTGATKHEYRFTSGMMTRSGALLLLSGSPMFALLCALWLIVTLWPLATSISVSVRHDDRVDNAMPAPLT